MTHKLPFGKLLFGFAALLATACAPASARGPVELSVVDRDSGRTLPQYPHRGDRWIAGAPGHRYSVRLTNTSGRRVLAVLSVDGVNAVSGQTADPAQAGYVLGPYESAEISGWRKSLDDVAQFYFTDLGDSYAARTGRPRNVGVIGVAVFEERTYYAPRPAPPPIAGNGRYEKGVAAQASASVPQAREAMAEASAASDSVARQRIGTGHGEREWAPVGQTHFVRASRHPVQVSEVRYDELRRLVALGIVPRMRPYAHDDAPRAFPNGFVADPPPGY